MRLRTLGGVALEDTDFTRPKPLLLLTYLALEGPQKRRHLAELFWPGATNHMKSLTVALARLRKGAPSAIEADHEQVWTHVETDAQQFLALLKQGETEGAVSLYRGAFLEDFYLRNREAELEEWIEQTRAFLAHHARKALIDVANKEAARARFEVAAQHAERAYLLSGAVPEPDELVYLHTLMLAGKNPKTSEVRKEAEEFGFILPDSTDAAKKQLHESLGLAASTTPHNLPMRGTVFIGRDLELTEITTLLARADCQLLTLTGPGGVGKTRLTLQVAHEQLKLGEFKDGIYVVSLESLTSSNSVPNAIADALGIMLQGTRESSARITDHIGDRNLLLILDGFEHLMDAAVMVSRFLEPCPNLKLLVTSRERLNLEEEHIFPILGLSFPKATDLTPEEARQFDAVKLFLQRAKRARPEFELTVDNLPHVLSICQLVEGLPLGLELSAVWVRIMPPHEIASEIQENMDFLTTSTRNVPKRHQSIRAAFEHSWQLLSSKEQEVLRKLSVFRGGFRREAASEVAGTTIPTLASLVDKSLLRVDHTGRYDRHPLLYQYTQEKLGEYLEERDQAKAKHAKYYFHWVNGLSEVLRAGRQKEALSVIEEELENLRVAWHWAVSERQPEELQRAVGPLALFFKIRGRRREGIDFFTQALPKGNETDPTYRAVLGNVLTAQARLYQDLGRYEEAHRLAERGLKWLRPLKDNQGMIRGLDTLGRVAWRSGDYLQAKGFWDEAMSIARTHEDHEAVATLLGDIAMIDQELGRYREAERHYLEAIAQNREYGNHLHAIRNLHNLGELYFLTARVEQAQTLWNEGLKLAEEIDFQALVPYFYTNLGLAAFELEAYQQAQALHQQALRRARESGDTSLEASILARLSSVATALGDLPQAQGCCEQALKLSWEIQDQLDVLASLISLAELRVEQGKFAQAASLVELALHHRTTGQYDRKRAKRLLQTLTGQLTPEVMDGAIERGKAMRVEEVVDDLLQQRAARSSGAE